MSHIFDSYCLTIDSSCSAYNICTIALNCHPKKHVLEFIFASPPPLTHGRIFRGDVLHYEERVNTTFLYKNFYIGCRLDFTVHYQLSSHLWIALTLLWPCSFSRKKWKISQYGNGNFCHSNSYLPWCIGGPRWLEGLSTIAGFSLKWDASLFCRC